MSEGAHPIHREAYVAPTSSVPVEGWGARPITFEGTKGTRLSRCLEGIEGTKTHNWLVVTPRAGWLTVQKPPSLALIAKQWSELNRSGTRKIIPGIPSERKVLT